MSLSQAVSVLPSSKCLVPQSQRLPVRCCPARVVMRKKDIHPEYFKEAKVYCKGEHVLTTSGTQEEYHVDIWSGNHPFFQGKQTQTTEDDGPLSRFRAKYPDMGDLMIVPTLTSKEPDNLDDFKKKPRKPKN